MSEQKAGIMQQLNEATASQIVNIPVVAERFKNLYVTFNGKDSKRFYEAEKFHFAKIIQDNPKIAACTKLSLYGCFLDMAVSGLSFDPAMKHAYITPQGVNIGTKQSPVWEQRAQVRISGIGELVIREKQGQIKYADNPVLVYEGDKFMTGTKDNALYISHEVAHPRKPDAAIIACYLRITRADDSVDYKVITMPEVEKLRKFSKDPDSKAWTDGLPGMVQAKCVKHAFRTYPKIRMIGNTKFTELASKAIDIDHEDIDIYQIDNGEEKVAIAETKTVAVNPEQDDDFAKANDQIQESSKGIVHPDEDNF